MSELDLSSLNHRARRAYLKKKKRKQLRQAAARTREEAEAEEDARIKSSPSYNERMKKEQEQLQLEEEHRNRAEKAWLEREKVAQELWQVEQAKIRAERQSNETNQSVNVVSEETRYPGDSVASEPTPVAHQSPTWKENSAHLPLWHHPPLPVNLAAFGQQPNSVRLAKQEVCSFFRKTGACRFGTSCSRYHDYPVRGDHAHTEDLDDSEVEQHSRLVLRITDMFEHPQLRLNSCSGRNADDPDAALEVDELQLLADYEEFYWDVLEELEARWGRIAALRTCRNRTVHLRGTVFVEFARGPGAAWDAAETCQGRWFAGHQLSCTVVRLGGGWREAVCGLYHRGRCPKGDEHCNFLHVFLNPNETVFDLHSALRQQLGALPIDKQAQSRNEKQEHHAVRLKRDWTSAHKNNRNVSQYSSSDGRCDTPRSSTSKSRHDERISHKHCHRSRHHKQHKTYHHHRDPDHDPPRRCCRFSRRSPSLCREKIPSHSRVFSSSDENSRKGSRHHSICSSSARKTSP